MATINIHNDPLKTGDMARLMAKRTLESETVVHKLITTTVKEVKGKDRVLEFIGSTEGVDRDGEVIKANAWEVTKYTQNPVVQWAHNYSEPPIGKTISIRQSKGNTIFEIEFADKETYEFADTIFKLCKGGFLNATSVGFIPLEWDKARKDGDPSRTFTKVELLEISIVPVPSNPEALVTARNAGVISMKEFDHVTKPEETDDYFRVPVPGESGKHKDCKIRTIEISAKDGIKALYCIDDKVNITYLFDKKHEWTMAKAEAWVKEHQKAHEPRPTTQEELADNLDFTLSLVKTVGLSEQVKSKALELSNEIRRLTGDDIPVVIKEGTAIRDMMSPIIKMMDDHHAAHMGYYKACKDAMEELCNHGRPELPDGDEDQTVTRTELPDVVKAIVDEIIKRKQGEANAR